MAKYAIPASGRSGGIIAFWRSSVGTVAVMPVGRQAFVAVVKDGARQPWIFVGIYASTNAIERRELWHSLT